MGLLNCTEKIWREEDAFSWGIIIRKTASKNPCGWPNGDRWRKSDTTWCLNDRAFSKKRHNSSKEARSYE